MRRFCLVVGVMLAAFCFSAGTALATGDTGTGDYSSYGNGGSYPSGYPTIDSCAQQADFGYAAGQFNYNPDTQTTLDPWDPGGTTQTNSDACKWPYMPYSPYAPWPAISSTQPEGAQFPGDTPANNPAGFYATQDNPPASDGNIFSDSTGTNFATGAKEPCTVYTRVWKSITSFSKPPYYPWYANAHGGQDCGTDPYYPQQQGMYEQLREFWKSDQKWHIMAWGNPEFCPDSNNSGCTGPGGAGSTVSTVKAQCNTGDKRYWSAYTRAWFQDAIGTWWRTNHFDNEYLYCKV